MADAPKTGKSEIDPRVLFAAEMTLLAWIRTGVAMMGFGFVVARFGLFIRELTVASGGKVTSGTPHVSPIAGTVLILFGATVIAFGGVTHVRAIRRLQSGAPLRPRIFSTAMVISGLLVIGGIVLAIAVVV